VWQYSGKETRSERGLSGSTKPDFPTVLLLDHDEKTIPEAGQTSPEMEKASFREQHGNGIGFRLAAPIAQPRLGSRGRESQKQ